MFASLIKHDERRITLDQEDRAHLRFPSGRIETIVQWVKDTGTNATALTAREAPTPSPLAGRQIGYLPMPPQTAHLLFQLVAARYETGSILLTSNQAIVDWGRVLGDDDDATAILDRLLHHCQVITIQGDSYRLCTKRRAGMVGSRNDAIKEATTS